MIPWSPLAESVRPDRVVGMARLQADPVHDGIIYDLVVDTSGVTPGECARTIASRLTVLGD